MPALRPRSRVPRIQVLAGGHFLIGWTLVLGLLAAHTGPNLLHAMVALLLGFQAVSGLRSFLGVRGVSVEAVVPRCLDAGRSAPLEVIVRNGKRRLPARSLEVEVVPGRGGHLEVEGAWVGRLGPGEEVRLRLLARGRARGAAGLAEIRVSSAWPCDLFRRVLRFPLDAEVLVRPARRDARPPGLGGEEGARSRASPPSRVGEDLRGVRPWREGDPPRAIHWRTSARAGAWVVREHEARRRAPWAVVVAPGEGPQAEDDLEVAAALCRAAVGLDAPARLHLAGVPVALEVRRGPALDRALDALARWASGSSPPPPAPAGAHAYLVGRGAQAGAAAASVRSPFAWVGPRRDREASA